jgi:hypothetical protein
VKRRHLVPAAAVAATALLLAGCGGGGGGSAAQGDSASADSLLPISSGVGADQSATQAIAALGTPGSVDAAAAGQTLAGYDSFGAPHDAFDQQVKDNADAAGSEAGTGATIPADTPINTDPLVAVPGDVTTTTGGTGAGGGTTGGTTDPSAGAPVQNPRALEADFDISGEPVVAREGDAIPPDTQQFVVDVIGASQVTLKLSGGLLPDGSDTVTLKEGESITLYNATARRSYRIKLVDIRAV